MPVGNDVATERVDEDDLFIGHAGRVLRTGMLAIGGVLLLYPAPTNQVDFYFGKTGILYHISRQIQRPLS